MSLEQRTRLRCDLCGGSVSFPAAVSKTIARSAAKAKFKWRVDKLNRDVCGAHPRINRRKTADKEK